jgi:cytochrome c-type biogenesis protein CcmF
MRILGEICLLIAFVASGFAAFASLFGGQARHVNLIRTGCFAAVIAFIALTGSLGVLAAALVTKDFAFDYVTRYTNQLLAGHYSLSALWVGQSGSLLLWCWITAAMSFVFRFSHRVADNRLEDVAFGIIMGFVCFLLAIMVFAADPMKASLSEFRDGAGLSPLLQHPAMMIHPPVVFAGYAAWTMPFALAIAALITGQLDLRWVQAARPWAILAWSVLGSGILLGGYWAYEELGWGGYWSWDPVENGSLIPWLTGTVLIHSLMVWRYCDGLKKCALALAIGTFGLCNFATFLTRSGIFSSLHAFSQSPIGWMFLVLMGLLLAAGAGLITWRRRTLASTMVLRSVWARETQVLAAGVALLLLTAIVLVGTILVPTSTYLFGTKSVVGAEFYNAVLAPIGLLLLTATVAAPLLRWKGPPSSSQRILLGVTFTVGVITAIVGLACGVRRPEALAVTMLAGAAPVALIAALLLDAHHLGANHFVTGIIRTLRSKRRTYAGFLIHLGFVAVALGVTGSSLASQRQDSIMREGDRVNWSGREIHYVRLVRNELSDKLVVAAELEIKEQGGRSFQLTPARHFHLLQEQWTTEVDINSSWAGDFYTILNNGEGGTAVSLTFVENPLMRWLWLGGYISGIGAVVTLWPSRPKPQIANVGLNSTSHCRETAVRPMRAAA